MICKSLEDINSMDKDYNGIRFPIYKTGIISQSESKGKLGTGIIRISRELEHKFDQEDYSRFH